MNASNKLNKMGATKLSKKYTIDMVILSKQTFIKLRAFLIYFLSKKNKLNQKHFQITTLLG